MSHSYYLTLNPSPLDEGLGILQILAVSSPMWYLYDLSLNPSPLDEGLGILQILAVSSPLSRGEGPGVRFSDVAFV